MEPTAGPHHTPQVNPIETPSDYPVNTEVYSETVDFQPKQETNDIKPRRQSVTLLTSPVESSRKDGIPLFQLPSAMPTDFSYLSSDIPTSSFPRITPLRPFFPTILPKTISMKSKSIESSQKPKKSTHRRLSANGLTKPTYSISDSFPIKPIVELSADLALETTMTDSISTSAISPLEPTIPDSSHNRIDIVCICGNSSDSFGTTIQCEQCFSWQHLSCLGLTRIHTKETYLCPSCREDVLDVTGSEETKKKRGRRRKKVNEPENGNVEISSLPSPTSVLIQATDPHLAFEVTPYDASLVKSTHAAKVLVLKQWYELQRLKKRSHAQSTESTLISYPQETPPPFISTFAEDLSCECLYRKESTIFAALKDSHRARLVYQSTKIRLDTEFLIQLILRNSSTQEPTSPDILALADELSKKRFEALPRGGVFLDLSDAPPESLGVIAASSLSSSLQCYHTCEAGVMLGLFGGRLCTTAELACSNRRFVLQSYLFHHPTLDLVMDTTLRGNVTRFIRRSCRPNVAIRGIFTLSDNAQPSPLNPPGFVFGLFSTRALYHGEELFLALDFDCGNTMNSYPCGCDRPSFCLMPAIEADLRPFVEIEEDDRRRKEPKVVQGHQSMPNLSAFVRKRRKIKRKLGSSSLAASPVAADDVSSDEDVSLSPKQRQSPPRESLKPALSREERKLQMIIESINRAEEREKRKLMKHKHHDEDEWNEKSLEADEIL